MTVDSQDRKIYSAAETQYLLFSIIEFLFLFIRERDLRNQFSWDLDI
jgi:hypothetical protein